VWYEAFVWTTNANVRKTRWWEFMSEYDFEIKHIKGKENQVVNALNSISHEVHIAMIIM
jgi:hypothetical protein